MAMKKEAPKPAPKTPVKRTTKPKPKVTGNSLAVMKVVLNDDGDTEYSLKFKEIVTLSQLKTLVTYLDTYVAEVIEIR